MKLECIEAGDLDVKAPDAKGVQRLWRIPHCYQPVIDGMSPHDQIRIHRPVNDMKGKRWKATCAYTGLSVSPAGQTYVSRDKAVKAALDHIASIEDMQWLIDKARIPDDEPVYICWYERAGKWLKPQYKIRHHETSAAAAERHAASVPSGMEKVRGNNG